MGTRRYQQSKFCHFYLKIFIFTDVKVPIVIAYEYFFQKMSGQDGPHRTIWFSENSNMTVSASQFLGIATSQNHCLI